MLIKIHLDNVELNRKKTKLLQSKEKHFEEAIVIRRGTINYMDQQVEFKY